MLLLWALVGLVSMVVLYLATARLLIGQRIDFSAFEGRKWTGLWTRRRVTGLLSLVTPAAVVFVTGWSVWYATRFRGWTAALAVGVAPPLTILMARVLKIGLPREELLAGSWVDGANGFPSGHTATLTVAMLGLISVSSPRLRSLSTVLALVVAAGHMLAMSGTGWHRPSDLAGGLMLAIAVGGSTGWFVTARWKSDRVRSAEDWFDRPDHGLIAVGSACGVACVWLLIARILGSASYGSFKLYAALTVGLVALTAVSMTIHAMLADRGDAAACAGSRPPAGSNRSGSG